MRQGHVGSYSVTSGLAWRRERIIKVTDEGKKTEEGKGRGYDLRLTKIIS